MSMAGRINSVKMIVLPRFLYFFQSLPCFIPQSFFKQLDMIIVPFLWNYKNVRISKKHLCKTKKEGGFGLPQFKYYYWAANLNIFAWWKKKASDPDKDPSWLRMEQEFCNRTSLAALLNSPIRIDPTLYDNHFVIKNELKIWKQIKAYLKAPDMYLDSPICQNHAFTPGFLDSGFTQWERKGIKRIKDLYIDGTFASFEQLKKTFNIKISDFFRYLQVRDFVKKQMSNFNVMTEHNVLEQINMFNPLNRGAVSYFYSILLKHEVVDEAKIKQAWEIELGVEIDSDSWKEGLENIHTCSINVRHNLIQFQTLHRLYLSKVKLHSIFPEVSPFCNRCKVAEGSLTHIIWLCPKLQEYWENIFDCFSKAFKKNIEPCPLLAIIGIFSNLDILNKYERRAILFGMTIAKRVILRMWKSEFAPKFEMWGTDLVNMLVLERLRYINNNNNNDKSEVFDKTWGQILEYLKVIDVMHV